MHIAHCRLSTRYSTQPSLFISYSSTLDDRSDRPLLLVEFDMKVVSSSASSIPSCCSGRVLLLQMSCRRSPTMSNRSSPAPKFPFDRHPSSTMPATLLRRSTQCSQAAVLSSPLLKCSLMWISCSRISWSSFVCGAAGSRSQGAKCFFRLWRR